MRVSQPRFYQEAHVLIVPFQMCLNTSTCSIYAIINQNIHTSKKVAYTWCVRTHHKHIFEPPALTTTFKFYRHMAFFIEFTFICIYIYIFVCNILKWLWPVGEMGGLFYISFLILTFWSWGKGLIEILWTAPCILKIVFVHS